MTPLDPDLILGWASRVLILGIDHDQFDPDWIILYD